MYNELKEVAHEQGVPFLTTRTWTTNDDHLRFLLASGFCRVIEVPSDRAPGIGTVYLAYPVGHLRC